MLDRTFYVGFYRLPMVLRILGISESNLYAGMDMGRYPPSYSTSGNTVGWYKTDIILMKKYIAKFKHPDQSFKWKEFSENAGLVKEVNDHWETLPPHTLLACINLMSVQRKVRSKAFAS